MQRSFFVLLWVLFASACTRTTIIIQNPPITKEDTQTPRIQLIHASPGTAGIKLWQNNATSFTTGYYYKSFTQYFPIEAGNTQLEIKRSSNKNLLLSFPATINESTLYSLFICDSLSRITPVLISDKPLPKQSDKAQIRFVNILSSGEPLNFVLQQNNLFQDVTYKNASDYVYVDPGVVQCAVTYANSGNSLISNITYALDAGKNYTVFVNGFSFLTGPSGADALIMTNL
jgi:hypothetical protein